MEKELPGTEYSATAVKYRETLKAEKEKFTKVKAQVEAKKVEFAKKQKIAVEKIEADNANRMHAKDQVNAENRANQTLRDSAKLATPTPAATFKIRR